MLTASRILHSTVSEENRVLSGRLGARFEALRPVRHAARKHSLLSVCLSVPDALHGGEGLFEQLHERSVQHGGVTVVDHRQVVQQLSH